MRTLLCAVVVVLLVAGPAPAQSPVAEVEQIRFHSSFWQNLHLTLYAVARASLPSDAAVRRLTASPDAPLSGDLSAAERTAWDGAVAFYRTDLARRDLRTGEHMTSIHWALAASSDTLAVSSALTPTHRRHLEAAAPVFRTYWWPAQDRAIREWIADVGQRIRRVGPRVRARLTELLEVPWFGEPVRVEITYYGRAYTTLNPRPLTVLALADPAYTGWAGAEMVFHEVSHARIDRLDARIGREADAAGKRAGDLWHVAMFYLVGETWRSELAAEGITYEPYLYATGLFDRAWASLRRPIETHLGALVRGQLDHDAAFRRLVAALPDGSAPRLTFPDLEQTFTP